MSGEANAYDEGHAERGFGGKAGMKLAHRTRTLRDCWPRSDDEQERSLIEQFASEETDDGQGAPRSLATLVINVWHEAEHTEPLRARITARYETSPEGSTRYAGSREAILAEVERWLDEVAEA